MYIWWFVAFSALTVGGGMVGSYHHQRKRLRAWRKAVESCGFQVVKTSSPMAMLQRLQARAEPVALRIRDTRTGMRIVVSFPGPPGFAGVRIRREVYKLPGAREIEVGDETFDGKLYIEGPMRLLTVLLDAETRDLLLRANACGRLEIFRSEIRIDTPYHAETPDLLPLLLKITRRFSQQVEAAEIAQRLAENALHDPEAGVRLRNLLLLAREFPGEPGTREALRAACADPIPHIRLRAAMELGAEGRDILLEFAESPDDDDASAQAIARLGRDLPFDRLQAILGHALRRRRLETARACLEVLGASGDAAAVDVLEKVLAVEQGELAAAAALALGEAGSPDAGPALLRALQRERADLRVAAATALGRVGSPAAVLPLKEIAERSSGDPDLRRATRQAIAQIQSRLQGASPGQLSLTGVEAGHLSFVEADAGQLSLTQTETGQLSLPPES